jgi:hypothetical protein
MVMGAIIRDRRMKRTMRMRRRKRRRRRLLTDTREAGMEATIIRTAAIITIPAVVTISSE